jgi:hypothetical protein
MNDFTAIEQLESGVYYIMKCKLCGGKLTNKDEDDDNGQSNREVLESCSNNSSDIVNTIEYLLSCIDCKQQTGYGYLSFAIQDAREHVLTSGHKLVTISEIIWEDDKALEVIQIDIKLLYNE